MKKFGRIISIDDDKTKVSLNRSTLCGEKCSSCKSNCEKLEKIIEVKNTIDAKPGDMVSVEVNNKKVLKAAFLVYIFPLIMLIIGVIISPKLYNLLHLNMNKELFSIIDGFTLMSLSFFIIKLLDNRLSNNYSFDEKLMK